MSISSQTRGCAAEMAVFLEKRVGELEEEIARLRQELAASQSFYQVVVLDRDFERMRCDRKEQALRSAIKTAGGMYLLSAQAYENGID